MDTIVICTATGLVVIISGVYGSGLTGGALTSAAFDALMPFGGTFVRVSIILFAVATILGWSFYGERCWGYISNDNRAVNLIFKASYAYAAFIGAASNSGVPALRLVWDISDTLNGMMAFPNLIALLFLSRVVFELTNEHFAG